MTTSLRRAVILLLASLTLFAGLGASGSALAATGCHPAPGKPAYPPGQCKKPAASDTTVQPGETTTFYSGQGQFDAGSLVTIRLSNGKVLGTVRADASGAATFRYRIPGSMAQGSYQLIFTGTFFGAPHSVAIPFRVVGPGTSGSGGGIPFTGSYLGNWLVAAAGIILIGTWMIVTLRRRRGSSEPASPAPPASS